MFVKNISDVSVVPKVAALVENVPAVPEVVVIVKTFVENVLVVPKVNVFGENVPCVCVPRNVRRERPGGA